MFVKPSPDEGFTQEIVLPCGKCIECRVSRSQEWATRIAQEAQMHPESSFVTLTYTDDQLPRFGSLSRRHVQAFLKRLRDRLSPRKIRYFAVGEYGDTTKRAHYHVIIFGWHPKDGKFLQDSKSGNPIFTSEFLDQCWSHGHTNFAIFEPASGEYVARYCVKKLDGEAAEAEYVGVDASGEYGPRAKEFALMSRRPGIGSTWFDQYYISDVSHRDHVVSAGGKKMKVPRYYDKLVEKRFGAKRLRELKIARRKAGKERASRDDRPYAYALDAKEAVSNARLNQYKRNSL